jgi:peptidylprolyl isomerase
LKIETGDLVRIHYTAKLENGDVVESTYGGEPVKIKIGAGTPLPALEESLKGLTKGDKKTVTLPPSKGFGERTMELVKEFPKSSFEGEVKASPGDMVQLKLSDGTQHIAKVNEVKQDSVVFDLNHPLAGETLVFEIEVVDATSG